jgi:hypothetical protein
VRQAELRVAGSANQSEEGTLLDLHGIPRDPLERPPAADGIPVQQRSHPAGNHLNLPTGFPSLRSIHLISGFGILSTRASSEV